MTTPARPDAAEDAADRPPQDEQATAAGSAAGPGKGRFLVRICFQGDEGACPTRDFVVGALILRSIGMDPSDIYAVIQIPGSREFDVSFRSAEKLALFLRVYEEKREQEDCWENFVVLGRSKSSLKTLFILFRNAPPGFAPPLPRSRGAAHLHKWLLVSPVPTPGSRRGSRTSLLPPGQT